MQENTFYAAERSIWREWLIKNHATENSVWLIFYKKHTKIPTVTYNEAVEEALCFGWIDSIVRRIDDDRYMQKFTPRKKNSKWSDSNKVRIVQLLKDGKMHEMGLKTIQGIDFESVNIKQFHKTNKTKLEIPKNIEIGLKENFLAWENFTKLAQSHKSNYIRWITSAKKEVTMKKRIAEAINLLEKDEKLGLK